MYSFPIVLLASIVGGVIGLIILSLLPLLILQFLTKKPAGTTYEGKHVLVGKYVYSSQTVRQAVSMSVLQHHHGLPEGRLLITGGSQGIGLQLAKICAEKGSHVSILARSLDQLEKAKQLIEKCRKYPDSQMVQLVQCDLASSYENVENAIRKAEKVFGENVQVLINAAGFSQNKYFEDFSVDQFRMMMDVNYFGALYATKAVMNNMKLSKSGTIAFLSSQGAQVGFIGMCCYSPTKYALKGLSECLQNELLPFNINVAVVYPPDTDTPGFANENLDKALECREISSTSTLVQPEVVAQQIVSELELGRYSICVGMDGVMLNTVTSGMLPYESLSQAYVQVYLIGIFRLIAMFYATYFQSVVLKHKEKRKFYNPTDKH